MATLLSDIIHDTSNRRKHFIGGLLCGLFCTLPFALGIATGMEFKDSGRGKWDWRDWWATTIGGTIGQSVQAGLIWLLIIIL